MASGQNVEDIIKYSTLDGSLDILERLLEWRHLAPTAPGLPLSFPESSCFLSYPSCFLSYPGLATRIASPRTHCSWSFFPPSLIPFLFLFLSNSKRGVSSSLVPLPTAFCLSQHACANRRRKAREWGRERARARARPPARCFIRNFSITHDSNTLPQAVDRCMLGMGEGQTLWRASPSRMRIRSSWRSARTSSLRATSPSMAPPPCQAPTSKRHHAPLPSFLPTCTSSSHVPHTPCLYLCRLFAPASTSVVRQFVGRQGH